MAYISFQPQDYFNTKLYTGNGSTNAITGIGFSPSWVWIKSRGLARSHQINDAVRGAGKILATDNTGAEFTDTNRITTLDSDGFTLGSNDNVNGSSDNLVSWNWKANGAGSSNTDGSITSTVSANTTSGFSIIQYNGNGTAGATIGHGLGVTPSAVFYKSLSTGNWFVYHKSIPATKHIVLNSTNAEATSSTIFNDTAPTSSLLTIGNYSEINGSGNSHIAYCFAQKSGFSSMGSYTGNGNADGTFVYTGFKPAFVLGKNATVAGQHWFMNDNKRGINGGSNWLKADSSGAELTNLVNCDLLSNGFKLRNNNDIFNDSGETFIYMAFSEESIVSSNGIPATAK